MMKKLITIVAIALVATGCSSSPTIYNGYENICYSVGATLGHDQSETGMAKAGGLILDAEKEYGYNESQCKAVAEVGFEEAKEMIAQVEKVKNNPTYEDSSPSKWKEVGMKTLQVMAVVLIAAGEVAQQQQAQQAEADRQFFDSINRQREMENAVHNALQSRGY